MLTLFFVCLKLPAASKDTKSASRLSSSFKCQIMYACCDFREEFSKKIKEGWGGI